MVASVDPFSSSHPSRPSNTPLDKEEIGRPRGTDRRHPVSVVDPLQAMEMPEESVGGGRRFGSVAGAVEGSDLDGQGGERDDLCRIEVDVGGGGVGAGSSTVSAPTVTDATAGRGSSQANDSWYGCSPQARLSRSTSWAMAISVLLNPGRSETLIAGTSRSSTPRRGHLHTRSRMWTGQGVAGVDGVPVAQNGEEADDTEEADGHRQEETPSSGEHDCAQNAGGEDGKVEGDG